MYSENCVSSPHIIPVVLPSMPALWSIGSLKSVIYFCGTLYMSSIRTAIAITARFLYIKIVDYDSNNWSSFHFEVVACRKEWYTDMSRSGGRFRMQTVNAMSCCTSPCAFLLVLRGPSFIKQHQIFAYNSRGPRQNKIPEFIFRHWSRRGPPVKTLECHDPGAGNNTLPSPCISVLF